MCPFRLFGNKLHARVYTFHLGEARVPIRVEIVRTRIAPHVFFQFFKRHVDYRHCFKHSCENSCQSSVISRQSGPLAHRSLLPGCGWSGVSERRTQLMRVCNPRAHALIFINSDEAEGFVADSSNSRPWVLFTVRRGHSFREARAGVSYMGEEWPWKMVRARDGPSWRGSNRPHVFTYREGGPLRGRSNRVWLGFRALC